MSQALYRKFPFTERGSHEVVSLPYRDDKAELCLQVSEAPPQAWEQVSLEGRRQLHRRLDQPCRWRAQDGLSGVNQNKQEKRIVNKQIKFFLLPEESKDGA